MQVIRYVRQLKQKQYVKIYNHPVKNSFKAWQFTNNLNKVIPNLTAELNTFHMSFNGENKEIDVGCWVRNADETYHRSQTE